MQFKTSEGLLDQDDPRLPVALAGDGQTELAINVARMQGEHFALTSSDVSIKRGVGARTCVYPKTDSQGNLRIYTGVALEPGYLPIEERLMQTATLMRANSRTHPALARAVKAWNEERADTVILSLKAAWHATPECAGAWDWRHFRRAMERPKHLRRFLEAATAKK